MLLAAKNPLGSQIGVKKPKGKALLILSKRAPADLILTLTNKKSIFNKFKLDKPLALNPSCRKLSLTGDTVFNNKLEILK